MPVAGSEDASRDVVFDLIDPLGFDPVFAGSLADSWRQQPDTGVWQEL